MSRVSSRMTVGFPKIRRASQAAAAVSTSSRRTFPALAPALMPATLSRPILHGLLRERMGFDGLVVTDALNMKGVLGVERTARA